MPDYWAKDLPVNVGQNNFEHIRYEYFRDRTVAFEAFKNGTLNFHEEATSRTWATGYDFPALREGRVKREEIPNDAPAPIQGWYFNTRRDAFKDPRIREADRPRVRFRMDECEHHVRLLPPHHVLLRELGHEGGGQALARRAGAAGALPRTSCRLAVFGEPPVPPVSDGSGQDRQLLRRADDLLRQAGCKREGGVLKLPNGQPFVIEFLDSSGFLQPHTQPFQANLKRLGIEGRSRIVDAAQYQHRLNNYDFDMTSRALVGSTTPGDDLRVVYGSEAARTPGAQNLAGIDHPAVDALIEKIGNAQTRQELTIACRALDRVLRSGHYWIPMWFKASNWLAYWDQFSRPDTKPRLGTGAPATWWYDADKAKRIGRG